jgi:phosphatidylinositol glycan class Q protein
MGKHNGLMRIFWPSNAPAGPLPGVLVGFRNAELDVFVVSVLQEVEVRMARAGLNTRLTRRSVDKLIMP